MMEYAQKQPDREIIGVFFGILDESGNLEIKEAYPMRVGEHTGVEFEDDDYVKVVPIIKACATKGLEWLGWFHSHPFRKGDQIYMSSTDIAHQRIQQALNPAWTAIVLNPHQIDDPKTAKGARAFQLKRNEKKEKITKKVLGLELILTD